MSEDASFQFRPLQTADFALLSRWHARPHIAEWWGALSSDDVATQYGPELIRPGIELYIVLHEGREIGFLQCYDATRSGDGWWPDAEDGTWGLDQFIGDPALLGQGLGSAFVKAFTDELLGRADVKKVILDPKPANLRAIRAYEKAGFVHAGVVETPDGPARLMEKQRA